MKFTKKQLEKIADQSRLLSWAQGAICYTDLHLFSKNVTIPFIGCFWILFQITALFIDKGD